MDEDLRNTSDPGYAPVQQAPAYIRQKPVFTLLDFISFPLLFVLFYLFLESILLPGVKTTVSYWGIFLLATADIVAKTKRFPLRAVFPCVICLASSFSFTLHEDTDLMTAGVILLLMLFSGIYCICLTGSNVHSFSSIYVLLDILRCELFIPVRNVFLPASSMHRSLRNRRSAEKTGPKKKRRILPVLLGLATGLLLLLVLIPLLIDSDIVFERLFGSAAENIGKAIESVYLFFYDYVDIEPLIVFAALVFTPYVFSVIFCFGSGTAALQNRDTSAKYKKLRRLSPVYFAAALGVVSMIYVVYMIAQSTYLFSAFSGHLPFGLKISVTEYARQGFFEMLKIAFVNSVLIFFSVGLCRRTEGRLSPVVRGFGVFLSVFSILICSISVSKILLYIKTYGLTEKRFFVFAGDIVLILSFLVILLRFFVRRLPYMKLILCVVSLAVTSAALMGVSSTIARYNANIIITKENAAFQVPELFEESGSASIPQLERISASGCGKARTADAELENIYMNHPEIYEKQGSFSVDLYRAKKWALKKSLESDSFSISLDFEEGTDKTDGRIRFLRNSKVILEKSFAFDGESKELVIERSDLPDGIDSLPVDVVIEYEIRDGANGSGYMTVDFEDTPLYCYFGRVYGISLFPDSTGLFNGYFS